MLMPAGMICWMNFLDEEISHGTSDKMGQLIMKMSTKQLKMALCRFSESDLSLLSDPQKVRQLAEALSVGSSKPVPSQILGSCSSNLPSDIFNGELSEKNESFESKHNPPPINNNSKMFLDNNIDNNYDINQQHIKLQCMDDNGQPVPPALPPVVISPADIDSITVQLEKNQQCACKDCGKLFNSVWYLKQHAVKHSNDRPFKCKFCMKTYKFRSNLYQHKCPERNRHMGGVGQTFKKKFYTRGIAYTEIYSGKDMDSEGNPVKLRSVKNRQKNNGEGVAVAASNSSNSFDINPFMDSQSNGPINGSSIFEQEPNGSGYAGQTFLGNSLSYWTLLLYTNLYEPKTKQE